MKQEKNKEEFAKYILRESGLESPSENFVSNIMDTIAFENSKSKVIIYKPLISKTSWVLIAISVIVLFGILLTGKLESSSIFLKIDASFLNKLGSLNIFENLKISTIFTFSCVLFSFLALFQLAYIKKYFNKNILS